MKKQVWLIALLLTQMGFAQSETQAIKTTLEDYLEGSSYNNPEQIVSAFYEEADLFLHKKDAELFIMSPAEYAALFAKREKERRPGCVCNGAGFSCAG